MGAINWTSVVEIAIVFVAVFGTMYVSKILRAKTQVTAQDLETASVINSFVEEYVLDDAAAKEVSRVIGKAIRYVETEMTNAPNDEKEQKAYDLVVEAITSMGLDTPIDEEALRKVIRLAVAFSEPTHPQDQSVVATFIK